MLSLPNKYPQCYYLYSYYFNGYLKTLQKIANMLLALVTRRIFEWSLERNPRVLLQNLHGFCLQTASIISSGNLRHSSYGADFSTHKFKIHAARKKIKKKKVKKKCDMSNSTQKLHWVDRAWISHRIQSENPWHCLRFFPRIHN